MFYVSVLDIAQNISDPLNKAIINGEMQTASKA